MKKNAFFLIQWQKHMEFLDGTKFYQFWYQILPILVPHFTNSGPNLPNFTKFWTKKKNCTI